MQLIRWPIAAGLVLLACAASFGLAQTAPPVDQTQPLAEPEVNQPLTVNALLGTVDGQPIFAQDVFNYDYGNGTIDTQLRVLASKAHSLTDFRAAARELLTRSLSNQISDIVMYHAARSNLSDDDQRRVDMFLAMRKKDLLTQYAGSTALAEEALHARGSSLEKEMDNLRRRATSDLYLRRLFWHRVTVTRRQLLDNYQQNIAKYTVPAQVDLYTITLKVRDFLPRQKPTDPNTQPPVIDNPTAAQLAAARDDALARARALIKQIDGGADFARLAEDNSTDPFANNGGRRRPAVKKGDLASQALEDYAFSLPANTVGSKPLVLNGDNPRNAEIVIVKVGAVDKGRVIPFSEAQDQIKTELQARQLDQMRNQYISNILNNAAIEAVDGTVNTPVDVARQRMISIALDAAVAKYAM